MNLEDTIFDIDGVEVKFKVKNSVVTVWAYSEKSFALDGILIQPGWVEVAEFDVRDYV